VFENLHEVEIRQASMCRCVVC